MRMSENVKVYLNTKNKVGNVIMALSKAFISLNHKSLFARFEIYDSNSNFSTFLKICLSKPYRHDI